MIIPTWQLSLKCMKNRNISIDLNLQPKNHVADTSLRVFEIFLLLTKVENLADKLTVFGLNCLDT